MAKKKPVVVRTQRSTPSTTQRRKPHGAELWIAVYHHEYGVDVWPFYFVPNGDLKYPSPAAVLRFFNVDYEPEKGETFELVLAHSKPIQTLSATEIVAGQHVGQVDPPSLAFDWPEESDEGSEFDDVDDMDSAEQADQERQPRKFTPKDAG